jgi:hypothetical protein
MAAVTQWGSQSVGRHAYAGRAINLGPRWAPHWSPPELERCSIAPRLQPVLPTTEKEVPRIRFDEQSDL